MASRTTSRSTVTINKSNPATKEYEMRQSYNMNASPFAGSGQIHNNVSTAVEGREREKRDMQDLNERLANYIEKVRFLEAQNKKLNNELNTLRERWGKEAEKIRILYEIEMDQLKKLLDEAEAARSELIPRINKLEEQLHEYLHGIDEANNQHSMDQEMIEKMNRQLSECEGEIGLLRRRIAALEEERGRTKKTINRLRDEIKRTRMDLDQETMNHIASESEVQSHKDQIDFMKDSHDNEMKELAALAYRDTTAENRDFWKSQMGNSLRELQMEYDNKLEVMRGELENHHNVKVQELRHSSPREGIESVHLKEENIRLKTQLTNLRSKCPELEAKNAQLERFLEELRRDLDRQMSDFEMEKNKLKSDLQRTQDELDSIMKEFQNAMDMKLSLELEIAAYRKLLEGEESRSGLRNMMEQTIFKTSGGAEGNIVSRSAVSNSMKSERNAKVNHQRTAKGNVIIHETSADGKFIILENTGKKDEDISGFKIIRNIDNNRSIVQYEIPSSTVLRPEGQQKFLKIWSKGNRPMGSNDLECQSSTWGTGMHIFTALLNKSNEERATHTQKTTYTN
uniref:Intermediate filament protein n=1 Tax=Dugesia japonica TaxID=6161 RepID=Q86M46_DUGJA|nr:intermediate filament protein [Dugesia japonica]